MSDETKHTVDEKIAVLLAGSSDGKPVVVEYKEFVAKVEELYKLNSIKAYDRFNVAFVKDTQAGWGVLFTGTRDETKDETAQREAVEAAKKKQLQSAELKEYLRLHKLYGKKQDQEQ